jgi:hypothetical protein
MSERRPARKSAIRVANLEAGMPTVLDALSRLDQELAAARRAGCPIMKLIHGYGSSGTGGDIRIAIQRRLIEIADGGRIGGCIFGEDWSRSDERTWKLLQARPELKQDRDLGRKNLGITIVLL